MRKIVTMILAALLVASPIVAKETVLPEVKRVIPIKEVSTEFLQEFLQGQYPDTVVECTEGTIIPVQSLHNFGIFSIKYIPNVMIKIEKLFYVRFVGKKAYFSHDLVQWDKDLAQKAKVVPKVKIDASGITIETNLEPDLNDDDDDDDDDDEYEYDDED